MSSDTLDTINTVSLVVRLLFAFAGMFLWGFVSKHIVKTKGYPDELNKGFWWGFWLGWIGLIVCCCKKPYFDPMNPMNQFNQYGQNNQFGQGGYNNYGQPNNFNQPGGYNNQYGQQTYQQPYQQTYQQPAQPTYTQPAQPTYTQPAQPTYQQPNYSQPQYGQPDNYYAQNPEGNKQYDSAAEMDGLDTSKLNNLDDLYK